MCRQGINIFRMAKDVIYLRQMLSVLSRFHTTYVVPGRRPETDMFSRMPWYHSFISSSLRVARGTQLLAHIPPDRLDVPPGADRLPFLE